MNMADLPAVNACLNGLSAVLLGLGYRFIRRKTRGAAKPQPVRERQLNRRDAKSAEKEGPRQFSAVREGVGLLQYRAHRNCMIGAFVTSIVFLACYLTYHGYVAYVLHRGPTRFTDPGWFRPIYLVILGTHTVLAMVIVPLALTTLVLALKKRFESHRRIARWTWPLWMYVSVTGVLIYLLLSQIFPQKPAV